MKVALVASEAVSAHETQPQGHPVSQREVSGGSLRDACSKLSRQAESLTELLGGQAEELFRRSLVEVLVLATADSHGNLRLDGLFHPLDGLPGTLRESIESAAKRTMSSGQSSTTVCASDVCTSDNVVLTAVPIRDGHAVPMAFVAVQLGATDRQNLCLDALEIVATETSLWLAQQKVQQLEDVAGISAAIAEMVTLLQKARTEQQVATLLIEQLADYLESPNWIIFGHQQSAKLRLLDRSSELADRDLRDLGSMLDTIALEAILRQEPVIWTGSGDRAIPGQIPLSRFAHATGSQRVLAIPLITENSTVVGAILAWGDESLTEPSDAVDFLTAVAEPVAEVLHAKRRARGGRIRQAIDRFEEKVRSRKGRIVLVILTLLGLLMLAPFPYRVPCECEVQPVHRRYLTTPFDGKLETAYVEPGDVVQQDQILVRLDEREIEWELAGIEADLQRLGKERDGHLSAGEYGLAEVKRFELERLQVKENYQLARLDELEIRSPIDGIVITGDLKKQEGSPLEKGQTLFEIAPLEKMTVELRIPENEIAYVREDQPVSWKFDAWPGHRWSGELESIQPRAEIIEEAQVFRGDVPIDNQNGMLRPGMQGRAWIDTGSRPLGWNLFHHAWENAVTWMGW